MYIVDLTLYEKNDKKALAKHNFDANAIQLDEELFRQITFLGYLKDMASSYGYDISEPAKTAKEAIQWTYFAYLGAIKEQNGAAMSMGRVSTFFDIYIERDIENGILTEETAQELIDASIIHFSYHADC